MDQKNKLIKPQPIVAILSPKSSFVRIPKKQMNNGLLTKISGELKGAVPKAPRYFIDEISKFNKS